MTQPLRCGLPTFLQARRMASTSPCPAGRREQGKGQGSPSNGLAGRGTGDGQHASATLALHQGTAAVFAYRPAQKERRVSPPTLHAARVPTGYALLPLPPPIPQHGPSSHVGSFSDSTRLRPSSTISPVRASTITAPKQPPAGGNERASLDEAPQQRHVARNRLLAGRRMWLLPTALAARKRAAVRSFGTCQQKWLLDPMRPPSMPAASTTRWEARGQEHGGGAAAGREARGGARPAWRHPAPY